jgi:hypothetical protein
VVADAIISQLHYVRVSNPGIALDRFPDFLIVGPQRTGTTWLHANLRYHPQVFLAEPKELFFFSRLKPPGHPQFQSDDLAWYLQFFRDPWWRWAMKQAICVWKYREPYRPVVRGEATASYAAIDRDVIAEIALLKPDVKAILTIRNPIDRAWSHAKKDLVRKTKRMVAQVPESEFKQFFSDEYQLRCARYAEQFDNWSACLREGHLLVCRFDDIASRPDALLTDVMAFLGVRRDRKYIGALAREAVNPTESSKIPETYRRFLEDLLRRDIETLEERFGMSWPR